MFRRLKSVVLEFSWNPLAKFSRSQNATPPPASCGQGRADPRTSGGRRTWAGTRSDGLAAPHQQKFWLTVVYLSQCAQKTNEYHGLVLGSRSASRTITAVC